MTCAASQESYCKDSGNPASYILHDENMTKCTRKLFNKFNTVKSDHCKIVNEIVLIFQH